MRRFALWAACLMVAVGVPGGTARAQENAFRFEIQSVGDSTFTFNVGDHLWVRRGLSGIAVDPRRRDVLVARFTVVRIIDGVATSLITGQTTRVNTTHVALLERPRNPWYKQTAFWLGTGAGFVIGVLVSR